MSVLRVKVKFFEEVLGLLPANTELHADFIASKAPDAKTMEEEIKDVGVEGVHERQMTVFPRTDDDKPCFYDYQVKGFFKDACGALNRIGGKKAKVNESSKLSAYKKTIDGLIFVYPRKIPIEFEGYMDTCQRSLRASTPQGERVALATSETCPEGATMEFEVECLDESLEAAVIEWLSYAKRRGFGCWRNSGKGRATYEILRQYAEPEMAKY